ncbi:MAG: hypothetical protein RLZZ546_803 [Bacteroidota bacterium]|jgi:hypothetical protein
MFGQIKKILGIEGVKLDLEIKNPVNKASGIVSGKIKLTTLRDSEVDSIILKMVEKYYRGRGESKLIDEYTIGFLELDEKIFLKKDEIIEVDFEVPFKLSKSEMDKLEDNILAFGLVKLAKTIKGVKSEYRIEAEAIVPGTKLNPSAKKQVVFG